MSMIDPANNLFVLVVDAGTSESSSKDLGQQRQTNCTGLLTVTMKPYMADIGL